MWKLTSDVISKIGWKKSPGETSQSFPECSDDDVASNASRGEGLECPICWESFNIVENVPHVLLCGHTLCKNCVLALQPASMRFPGQQIKVPFLISCPWCHLMSIRFFHGGNLKFPRKNFFLLWMVESLSGERGKVASSYGPDNQPVCSPKRGMAWGLRSGFGSFRNRQPSSSTRASGLSQESHTDRVEGNLERQQSGLPKTLDVFIGLISKFPLVLVFLLILFFIMPGCGVIMVIYLLLTVLFAVPSFLILYFAYPILGWLITEITS
ncbi:hypothetical protein MLD38_011913 [Melastoma candidum]|uniref:Uncharacterized protein n=1 Tax=Melastoma candidum TaxID=119954 RepID=A0ACB9R6E9_9MYRT|nr:hypothetical protein MLD38_011913 [Melastoma candidum]